MLHTKLPHPLKKVFIDLDDTLLDFTGSVYELLYPHAIRTNRDLLLFRDLLQRGDKKTRKEMWKKITSSGPDWWKRLDKLPWADALLAAANKACANVVILTSPGNTAGAGVAAHGKVEWALQEFGENSIILAYKKHMCSSPGSLLIDDYQKFIDPWIEEGGTAFKVKREWSKDGHTPEQIVDALDKYASIHRPLRKK